jgi:hypothetical protein
MPYTPETSRHFGVLSDPRKSASIRGLQNPTFTNCRIKDNDGAATITDLSGSFYKYNTNKSPGIADQEAIRRD